MKLKCYKCGCIAEIGDSNREILKVCSVVCPECEDNDNHSLMVEYFTSEEVQAIVDKENEKVFKILIGKKVSK